MTFAEQHLQEWMDELRRSFDGSEELEPPILDNITATHKIKLDANAQLVKLLDLDIKKSKKIDDDDGEDILASVIDE